MQYRRGDNLEILEAERSGKISLGDALIAVNETYTVDWSLEEISSLIKSAGRPVELSFKRI
jgi:hypothetical protein